MESTDGPVRSCCITLLTHAVLSHDATFAGLSQTVWLIDASLPGQTNFPVQHLN
jgi:hypothetical protein